jgi:TPR repeat protein
MSKLFTTILFSLFSIIVFSQPITDDSLKLLIGNGEKDDTVAQIFLANLYFSGIRINEDNEKAFYWCEKAAKLGSRKAMFNLGIFYEYGYGIKQDYLKAKYWYENASKLNNNDAMFALGQLYELHSGEIYANYKGDVAVDYIKAKYWYEKAANLGQSDAMFSLGSVYDDGKGIAKDYTKAKYWYEKAANFGHVDAMNNLGILYLNGLGLPKNYIKAKELFEKSAELENKYAFYNLGELYRQGYGVKEDIEMAKVWYEKAAYLEHDEAMNKLGVVYEDDDFNTAMYWYEKAAEYNNTSAMLNLGRIYRLGEGVEKDFEKAKYWFEKAQQLGNSNAYLELIFLESLNPMNINGMSLDKRKQRTQLYSYTDYQNGWIYLTETKNDIKLFKEVTKDGYSDIKVWVKSIPKSNQLTGYRNENAALFKSVTIKQKIAAQLSSYKSLYILNCKENKLGEKSSVYYTKDGSVIYTDNNELFNEYDMSEVIPETLGEDIFKTICEYYEKYSK